MNGSAAHVAGETLTNKELLNQFKVVEAMPDNEKNVIKELIDAFITKRKLRQLAG